MIKILINDKTYNIYNIYVQGNYILGTVNINNKENVKKLCKYSKKTLDMLLNEELKQSLERNPKPLKL